MPSIFAKVIDSFRTTTSGRGAGGNTLPLAGGAGAALGSLPAGRIFRVTAVLNPDTDNEQILAVLEATGISGNTLTGVTVSSGYSDANLSPGTFIDIRVCARDLSELQDALNAVEVAVGSGGGGGGGITALTGDVLATGPGSVNATLKTVNPNVGTFTLATIAVDAKGRITSAANGIASGPISTVFGRTGAILAADGDYAVNNVTGAAPLASPHFSGVPTAPTAANGTNNTQLATTQFVLANVGGGAVSSVFTRTGAIVAAAGDYTVSQVTGAAPLASPAFTGTPTGLKRTYGFGSSGLITTGQKPTTHYVDEPVMAYGLVLTVSAGSVTAQIEKSTDNGSTWTPVDNIVLSSGLSNTKSISAALAAGTLLRVNHTAASGCSDPIIKLLAKNT